MKKLTEEKARRLLREYFLSRRTPRRGQDGNPIVDKNGEVQYEERPSTVTGVTLALGLAAREDLFEMKDKKIRNLIDRALLKVEESAEERLFSKDTFNGAKLFLSTNFPRWRTEGTEDDGAVDLGVCTQWAE